MFDGLQELEGGWREALGNRGIDVEPILRRCAARLEAEQLAGSRVAPDPANVLAAFTATPFDRVRVVILGQDPYHGPGQATGLAFAVPGGVSIPPSLRNILREIEQDLGIAPPDHGDLRAWAEQGVLLLNTTLTVRVGEAGSHAGWDWQRITLGAIDAVAHDRNGVAFLLWGRHAQQAGRSIDRTRHLVLEAAHPSPLSAHRGFCGCRHFSQVNDWLKARGQAPINWQLPGPMR